VPLDTRLLSGFRRARGLYELGKVSKRYKDLGRGMGECTIVRDLLVRRPEPGDDCLGREQTSDASQEVPEGCAIGVCVEDLFWAIVSGDEGVQSRSKITYVHCCSWLVGLE